jgi:hypothetical protein
MAGMTYTELKNKVSSIVVANNMASPSFSVTRNNVAGLVDKIGAIVTLDTVYKDDKLAFMDDFYLPFGKTIEEWQQDLILPVDPTLHQDEEALRNWTPDFRPATYSYTIGHWVIPESIMDNNVERAVNNAEQLTSIVSMEIKRISDSMSAYRYKVKKEMVGEYISKIENALGTGSSAFATSTAYGKGAYVNGTHGGGTKYGVVFHPIPASNTQTFTQLVTAGTIILIDDMVQTLAKPIDTTTGEAFIKAIKSALEYAKDMNSGNALSGAQLGATEGLVLLINKGIIPSIQVDTMAGAFNKNELLTGVEMIDIDFGSYTGKAYAILCDKRALRLHNSFRRTEDQRNAFKCFTTIFDHTEDTAFASLNVFARVFKTA